MKAQTKLGKRLGSGFPGMWPMEAGQTEQESRKRHSPIYASIVASLEEVAAALRLLAERNRVIAEGAGAGPVACARAGRAGPGRIVCVVSGGNIDLARFCELSGGRSA